MAVRTPKSIGQSMEFPVPAALTRGLLANIDTRGLSKERLLWRAGFAHDPLRDRAQTDRASPHQYSRLCAELFRQLDDETMGAMPDAPTPPGTLRLIALSMLSSRQLGMAMHRAMEFNACCRARKQRPEDNRLQIDSSGREATLTYIGRDVHPRHQHRVLAGLGVWLRFCGWLIGQEIDVTRACCAGPQPPVMDTLRHFFPGPIVFDKGSNAVTFSARHLEADILRDESQLAIFMPLAPYFLLLAPDAAHCSTTARIRRILGDDFRRELPTFEALTGLLNMSARTLRRRLEREGMSYQRIKDNARRDRAIALLRTRSQSISAVAEDLGFSDPSAFHRSFKKWTGQSPGSFREDRLARPGQGAGAPVL
ncbi:hypothetical protein CWI75_01525 [Kineobactrum sediminis]|uniref:HTH araC/xylS-type domain-containing protein n=1 Tax=Kineobactrum sediminis TaxID=1905677 RepID=A0A2N5Y6P0_9GAMM|nr:AraC family transcriptional regulator [Kineobactrum sediminis]PLW84056.1 hypothetical protein CWI75_01525 [Kineobactrum sediminis]